MTTTPSKGATTLHASSLSSTRSSCARAWLACAAASRWSTRLPAAMRLAFLAQRHLEFGLPAHAFELQVLVVEHGQHLAGLDAVAGARRRLAEEALERRDRGALHRAFDQRRRGDAVGDRHHAPAAAARPARPHAELDRRVRAVGEPARASACSVRARGAAAPCARRRASARSTGASASASVVQELELVGVERRGRVRAVSTPTTRSRGAAAATAPRPTPACFGITPVRLADRAGRRRRAAARRAAGAGRRPRASPARRGRRRSARSSNQAACDTASTRTVLRLASAELHLVAVELAAEPVHQRQRGLAQCRLRPARQQRVEQEAALLVAVALAFQVLLVQQVDQPAGAPVGQPQRMFQRGGVGRTQVEHDRAVQACPAPATGRRAAHGRVRRGAPRPRAGAAPRWRSRTGSSGRAPPARPPPARSCRRCCASSTSPARASVRPRHSTVQPGGEQLLRGLRLRQHLPGAGALCGRQFFVGHGHGRR